MKKRLGRVMAGLLLPICLILMVPATGSAGEYASVKGHRSIKAVFDFELGNPQSALLHLNVIRKTFKDKTMWVASKKPEIVVVFIGPSVKLVSTNRDAFSQEDRKILDEYASVMSEMTKDGIKFEICLIAVKAAGVDPTSILPAITQVGNGWISLIRYQAAGYSLVPVN
jgi:intracellular sulfur oxidation DsrE/DsrF family protein